ncbi:MAG: threonine synthase, partial [Bdellovibrionales bacterium]|nr:threonine synthase [Bdellovibrionales bacterium]
YVRNNDREVVVLVATSGDTGTAVAHGFLGAVGIKVVILYPSGKVSPTQEAQLTTCGRNITALEVEGTFDDCQNFVKQAFVDPELSAKRDLTSANSINIARLIPQTFYYFHGSGQLKDRAKQLVISVPSGNLGNLTAGLFAKHMGLPVHRFVAATNANDSVPQYLSSGEFKPRPSVQTISNAMDVGNPSNFARILAIYDGNYQRICSDISGHSFSDKQTADAIKMVYEDCGYLMDPHGAVGYLGLTKEIKGSQNGMFLECAHPGKFHEIISDIISDEVKLPNELKDALSRKKQSILVPADYRTIRDQIIEST